MGKFVVTLRKDGEFQFVLKAGNGQVILASQGYEAKSSCVNGIESVRKNSLDEKRFEKKVSSNGKHFFNLTATNGQTIGTSEMYESEAACDNGIESVQKNAPDAIVDDQTA